MKRMAFQPSWRFSSLVLTTITICGLVAWFYTTTTKYNSMASDRSENYNVKVLPDIDDSQLAVLPPSSFSYLAMIDAGSSGCRAHVYRYGKLGSLEGPLYVIPQHVSKKVKPGLSSFASNPTDAGSSLQGLVEFLKEQVPSESWGNTPVWLKATAGLRMLVW